jgi:hypothetical protein
MRILSVIVVATFVAGGVAIEAVSFGDWSLAANVETLPGTDWNFNTAFQDGCPAPSRDGLFLYMASNRPGGQGGLDIWMSSRETTGHPWGAPVNLGAPINTGADEFCPTPLRDGHGLLFVSTKAGGCGGSDIYLSRKHVRNGWSEPENFGCSINSSADEASPFFVEYDDGAREFYFSSTRVGGFAAEPVGALNGDSDIYVSAVLPDGTLAAPGPAAGVNTEFGDFRPNVRRDGLEIFFDSSRPGGLGPAGTLDVWTATRSNRSDPWPLPVNAGAGVNSAQNESRPYLNWDGTALYVGSTRPGSEGSADIYVATRARQMANH